ncbi:MAG: hypothetical protein A3E79_01595 [Burkholderiales bacterium RIFCSPHIGHO2_12_FULL_61_11]|nr:MAG: hypothetical protein A3E79_01595 [Burkholderiales bacterium RIFCSPHIGHO2_12_FULL_61_11]
MSPIFPSPSACLQAYLYWIRFFVRWHGRGGQMRHPRDMGALEVTQFLTMLANERRASVSTHNQALRCIGCQIP